MNIQALSGVTKVVAALAGGGLLAGAIALGASGGNGGGSTPLAQVVAATATSVVEGTTSQTGSKLDPNQARTDCPQGWTYYNDSQGYFSFCYPSTLRATVGEGEPGGSKAITVDIPPSALQTSPDTLVFTIYWKPTSPFEQKRVPTRCRSEEVSFGGVVREEALSAAGKAVVACRGVGKTPYHGEDPVSIEMRSADGWIQVFAFHGGPNLPSTKFTVAQVIDSIRMP